MTRGHDHVRWLLGGALLAIAACAQVIGIDDWSPAGSSGSGATDAGTASVGGSGAGGGSSCASLCPEPRDPCTRATCAGGVCGTEPVPAGMPIERQVSGDCQARVCSAGAEVELVPDSSDIPPEDGNECTTAMCDGDLALQAPTDEGTPCHQFGELCNGAGKCVECLVSSDCSSELICAADGKCVPGTCTDGIKELPETDVDCGGGDCSPCTDGKACNVGSDCITGICTAKMCAVASCSDWIQNGAETDIDCGGPDCPKCNCDKQCADFGDCNSGECGVNAHCICCSDVTQNGDETDTDCGGACANAGHTCQTGQKCLVSDDCESGVCNGLELCNDPAFCCPTGPCVCT